MNASAEARASATCSGSSTPTSRKYACFQAAPSDVAGGEEVAPVQAAGEVEDRGALDDGVVDVEERRRGRVGRRLERTDSTSRAASAASPAEPRALPEVRARCRADSRYRPEVTAPASVPAACGAAP